MTQEIHGVATATPGTLMGVHGTSMETPTCNTSQSRKASHTSTGAPVLITFTPAHRELSLSIDTLYAKQILYLVMIITYVLQ